VGLDEDAVDLLEVHDAGLVADSFDERTQTQIASAAQESFAGADDQGQGFRGEGVVAEAGTVELIQNKLFDGFRSQALKQRGVSDAGADFLIDGKGQGLQQGRLPDEHEIVRARKVLAEQTEFAQAVRRHEVGIVNDGYQHFAGAVNAEGLLDEQPFAVMIAALELDLERFAKDAERVVVGVQSAVDHRRDHAFGVMGQERLFEDTFAGAGFTEHQTQPALLGVDAEDVEDFLLVSQQCDRFGVEGIALEAKMGTDHKLKFGWRIERFSVIGDGVEQAGFPHAFALVINDDTLHWPGALEPDVDRPVRQVPWRFKAERFEGERVVGADVAFLFNEKQLVIGLVGREEANPFAIQGIAVERTHAEDGMNLGVVLLLDPLGELAVERLQRTQVQFAGQELVPHGAKKSFDLSLGRAIPHRGVVEQAADAGADLDDLLGGVDGTIVHVERMGDAAFVVGGANGLNERVHVFRREELAVATNA